MSQPVASPRWIMTIPVVSTAHLDAKTGHTLAQQTMAGPGNPWELFVLPAPDGSSILFVGDDSAADLPKCLRDLFAKVKEWQYEWVRVDRDGDQIEGLATFEW